MVWNSLDCLSLKSLLWKGGHLKPNCWAFDFIKISAHIINKISKVWQNEKYSWGLYLFPNCSTQPFSFNLPVFFFQSLSFFPACSYVDFGKTYVYIKSYIDQEHIWPIFVTLWKRFWITNSLFKKKTCQDKKRNFKSRIAKITTIA
jgi:hypothetical protein